jgi:ribosomal protein S18 acetylase RimI-like enzyme
MITQEGELSMKSKAKEMPQVKVRNMVEEDIEGVLAIDRKITGRQRAATYNIAPGNYVGGDIHISVVAETSAGIVGFLMGRRLDSPFGKADTASLEMIGVDPEYQRRKVATLMARFFIERCREKGVRSIRATVSWQDWQLLSFLKSLEFDRGELVEYVKSIEA